jgi:hypothetical protein
LKKGEDLDKISHIPNVEINGCKTIFPAWAKDWVRQESVFFHSCSFLCIINHNSISFPFFRPASFSISSLILPVALVWYESLQTVMIEQNWRHGSSSIFLFFVFSIWVYTNFYVFYLSVNFNIFSNKVFLLDSFINNVVAKLIRQCIVMYAKCIRTLHCLSRGNFSLRE